MRTGGVNSGPAPRFAANVSPAGALGALGSRLAAALAAEGERRVLWLPVALGAGIGAYFALAFEPAVWVGPVLAGAAGVAFCGARGSPALRAIAALWLAAALGFAAAQLRTALVDAPRIAERLGPTRVLGTVAEVEPVDRGTRLVLTGLRIDGLDAARTPARIRLRLTGSGPPPRPGERVAVRAVLLPLPPPSLPGAFDFQRHAFFLGLGAVGFTLGRPEIQPAEGSLDWAAAVAALRHLLHGKVLEALGGDGAAGERAGFASALLTGKQGALSDPTMEAMRNSGLAHLLSISGLHMVIVAGFVFLVVRGGLALVPWVALRYPIKKWAAAAALLATGAYLFLAGATVPTQRSFLMLGLGMLAILTGRWMISMRPVAWAAAVVLLVAPESLLGASFQMSFAAVVALVAAYEALAARRQAAGLRAEPGRLDAWLLPAGRYLGGLLLTSLVATLATSGFTIFHFNQVTAYGLVANLAAVPITGFWVMPWGFVALALMPLGWEAFGLVPMGWGIDAILWVARTVSSWPGAVVKVSAMPVWGLVALALGGLWLCIWRRRWRLLGLAGVAAGLASPLALPIPDVLLSATGELAAVRGADGGLMLSSLRGERFLREAWAERTAAASLSAWPAAGASADGRLRCDRSGCIYALHGRSVAFVREQHALADDCGRADLVVARIPVSARLRGRGCSGSIVQDRFDLARSGAQAAWISPGAIRIASVGADRGDRPWVVAPERLAARRPAASDQ